MIHASGRNLPHIQAMWAIANSGETGKGKRGVPPVHQGASYYSGATLLGVVAGTGWVAMKIFAMSTRSGLRAEWRSYVNPTMNERLVWVWWGLASAGVAGGANLFSGTSPMTLVYVKAADFLAVRLVIHLLLHTDGW
jgi:hypothetical protein